MISFLTLPDGTNLARFTKFPGTWAMTALTALAVVLAVRRALAVLPSSAARSVMVRRWPRSPEH